MKELSIEEKAKAYDEAIEKLRNFYRDYDTVSRLIDVKEELANLFPQLKESEDEDERIRKRISLCLEECMHKDIIRDYERDECLAWLEKQDKNEEINEMSYRTGIKRVLDNPESYGLEKQIEQKEIDYNEEIKKCKDNPLYFFDKYVKVKFKEHKFKVGDIIRLKGSAAEYTIKRVTDTTYYTNGWSCGIEKCEEDYELVEKNTAWSEEDERERKRVIGLLEGWLSTFKETCYAEDCKCGIEWLKSLKERYSWKPSDEQIKALEDSIEFLGCTKKVREDLKSLYEQLKELKVDANMPIVCSV